MDDTTNEIVEEVKEESPTPEPTSLELSDEDFLAGMGSIPAPLAEEPIEEEEESIEEAEEEAEEEEESLVEPIEEDVEDTPQDPVEDATEESTEEGKVDYEEAYKAVLAPLRANGKDIKIDTIEDLRNLASMGVNYQSKMVGIKPYRKTAKKLENNGIDEATLDYLIDIHKGNPDAIQKMLKEHKIDPLDIDTQKDSEYSPNDYTVNDKEVELDEVLSSLQDSPSFTSTVDIISKKWDEPSKKVLLEHPEVIRVINDHVGSGVYEQITEVVERERLLGRLTGLSDLEAYKQVGDSIEAKGGFNKTQPKEDTTVTPTKKASVDPKLKSKKKAASSTKSRASKPEQPKYDPLSMSDEEFEKMSTSKYL